MADAMSVSFARRARMGNLLPGRCERPELTEKELSYITLHTNFTRKQIEDFHRRFYTFYPRGSVTLDQFADLYANELQHLRNAQPFVERLFHQIDTDRNGRLNFKEILFFKAISLPDTDTYEKLRWIFFLYDTNEDRQIDQEEFLDLCQLVYRIHGDRLTNERLEQLQNRFEQSDTNADRALNCEEFIELCQQCPDLLELMAPMFNNTKWHFPKKKVSISTTDEELTSNQIAYLIERTRFPEERIVHYHQIFRTRCRSGRLTKSEFIQFYQQILSSPTSESYVEFLFRAFDHLSKDGFVQFDEFLIGIFIHSQESSAREKLEWLYNAYDRNGDGTIDYTEINQIVHALFLLYGIDREKHSVSYVTYEIMATLDLNGDDRISRQEFLNVLKDKELTKFLAPSLVKQQKNET